MKQLSIYDQPFLDEAHAFGYTNKASLPVGKPSHYIKPDLHTCEVTSLSDKAQINTSIEKNSEATSSFTPNVTEIVLTGDKIESISLVLPMLINLHQEQRWLAWIDPPIQLLKEWKTKHNERALNEIMILRSNDNLSVFELSRRALAAGTCHAVIAWTNNLSQEEFSTLENASAQGQSHGIILKSRQARS